MTLSRRAAPSDFGLSVAGWRGDFGWIFRLGLIVLGVYLLIAAGIVVAVRAGWIPYEDFARYRDFRDMPGFWDYVLSALLCAPLVEELVYRGFAVPSLATGFGRRLGIFLSGPVFYLLHVAYGREWYMLHYNIAGWILAWAMVRTGRLWVPIVLHALGNVLMGLDDALFLFAPGAADWLLKG